METDLSLQFQTNLIELMQYFEFTYIHHSPYAGRPAASRQAGAAKKIRYENPLSHIPRFGGDMNEVFPKSFKKHWCACMYRGLHVPTFKSVRVCTHMYSEALQLLGTV